MRNETLTDNSKVTTIRTLLRVAPTGVTIPPRTDGFGRPKSEVVGQRRGSCD